MARLVIGGGLEGNNVSRETPERIWGALLIGSGNVPAYRASPRVGMLPRESRGLILVCEVFPMHLEQSMRSLHRFLRADSTILV